MKGQVISKQENSYAVMDPNVKLEVHGVSDNKDEDTFFLHISIPKSHSLARLKLGSYVEIIIKDTKP